MYSAYRRKLQVMLLGNPKDLKITFHPTQMTVNFFLTGSTIDYSAPLAWVRNYITFSDVKTF